MSAAAVQPELINDDPRCETSKGVIGEVRAFVDASREMSGLLTCGQAAKILGVSSGNVSTWVARGRLRARCVLGVKMVSGGDVLAFYKERTEQGIRRSGGRGVKAPTFVDLAKAAWEDIDPFEG